VNAPAARDVVVLGGGLAGLCLAIQLKRRDPSIDVLVLERRRHPVPEAAFKVGESTVEIGAHYFEDVLGLRTHLDGAQLRKFGFRFFFSDPACVPHGAPPDRIDRCVELGVSHVLPTPTWQLDRGRFENLLGERARALGVTFLDGAAVRRIEPGGDGEPHAVEWERDGARDTTQARWLVDASGRAGLLKRRLDLARDNDHHVHSAWWRVHGLLRPDDWGGDAAWRTRCDPPERWRSTNHLCGPGYWVWLIPLASGSHSIGIVADPALHPLAEMDTHERAMDWLRRHQPRLARALDEGDHALQDFAFLRRFSHGCRSVWSGGDRWATTGEAGVFLDPFYSPGSDYIAIANGYVTDLVLRDRAGEPVGGRASLYEQLYFSFYENMLTLYQDQYPLFGDAQVMPLKVVWDYSWYWTQLAPLAMSGRLCDLPLMGRLRPAMQRASALNAAMQPLLRAWGARNAAAGGGAPPAVPPAMLDQARIDWFAAINGGLGASLDDAAFAERFAVDLERLELLAADILAMARGRWPDIDDHGLASLLGMAPGEPIEAVLPDPWRPDAAGAAAVA
jgi:flavin-dependent dehydrogenase